MKTIHATLAVVAGLILSACGGGGGGGGSGPVGPQGVSVRLATQTRGPTGAEVRDYLAVFASGGPWCRGANCEILEGRQDPGIFRFSKPPLLRIAEGTDDHQRAMILHAVALVNHALPYDRHIRIGEDSPALAQVQEVPDGQIFVDFARHNDWIPRPRPEWLPTGQALHQDHSVEGQRQKRAARIWLEDSPQQLSPALRVTLSTMVHELLHALGLNGHVDPRTYPDSFLRGSLGPYGTRLGPLDIAALQALYTTRLGVATLPEDLSLESLGIWETETTSLTGSLGGMSFGVDHRNGVSVPWTQGIDPRWDEATSAPTTLASNRSLRGTVRWNGELLGFTPELASVRGNAEIAVALATMDGRADFTDMQSWAAGEEPGALGSQWNTGTLGYTITVGGNYLRSTGGDDGTLHGRFYGSAHEGVAGTVERADLTAAFGARR